MTNCPVGQEERSLPNVTGHLFRGQISLPTSLGWIHVRCAVAPVGLRKCWARECHVGGFRCGLNGRRNAARRLYKQQSKRR